MSDEECPHGEVRGLGFSCPACNRETKKSKWGPPFDAEFPGKCIEGDEIMEGDRIVGRDNGERRQYAHADCAVLHP